jgi:uncharacterized protein YkwD
VKRHPPRLLPLALLTASIALGAPPAAQARVSACASVQAVPSKQAIQQARLNTLCLLNRERSARGMRPLRMHKRLSVAAERHSRNMVRGNFFAHGNFVARILNAGYVNRRHAWSLGENIAWGTGSLAAPQEIVKAWMKSPGHRANILNRRFRDVGVGIVMGAPTRVNASVVAATYTTDFGLRG